MSEPNRDYQITRSWFRKRNQDTFIEYIHPEWTGKEMVYLEVGVFEGASMMWMMENVLTHPLSRAVGVDPWLITTKLDQAYMDRVMQRAMWNANFWNGRCILQRGNSAEVLRRMNSRGGFQGIKSGTVDLCMIDGGHNAYAVVDDAFQVFKLVKQGGWILFDDVENVITKKKDHVKHGLAMFLEEKGNEVERIFKHKFMECFRKK